MGRPARWKLTPNPPGAPLMSLTWFLARWHVRGRSAPPRQCILWAIGGPSPGSDRIDRMPATDPEGRPALARNQRFWHSRNLRRVAPASGRTSSASSRSASGLLTRTVSAQRIDHYRSWQPEPSFFTPHVPDLPLIPCRRRTRAPRIPGSRSAVASRRSRRQDPTRGSHLAGRRPKNVRTSASRARAKPLGYATGCPALPPAMRLCSPSRPRRSRAVLTEFAVCHAGGRGFESRRSR
jgi:hypothetical protein